MTWTQNRHTLFTRSTLIKYGFLSNGYSNRAFFWESVVFVRKFLFVGINGLVVSAYGNTMGTLMLGVAFLILHQLVEPFDLRQKRLLHRLEQLMFVAWITTSACQMLIVGFNIRMEINLLALVCLVVVNAAFFFTVAGYLILAACSWAATAPSLGKLPVLRTFGIWCASFDEWINRKEPWVVYLPDLDELLLVAAPAQGGNRTYSLRDRDVSFYDDILNAINNVYTTGMDLQFLPTCYFEFVVRCVLARILTPYSWVAKHQTIRDLVNADVVTFVEGFRREKAEETEWLAEEKKRFEEEIACLLQNSDPSIAETIIGLEGEDRPAAFWKRMKERTNIQPKSVQQNVSIFDVAFISKEAYEIDGITTECLFALQAQTKQATEYPKCVQSQLCLEKSLPALNVTLSNFYTELHFFSQKPRPHLRAQYCMFRALKNWREKSESRLMRSHRGDQRPSGHYRGTNRPARSCSRTHFLSVFVFGGRTCSGNAFASI